VSGEAILSAENGGKPLGGRGFVPNPDAGELTALPQTTQLVGRGIAAPHQEPQPHFGPSVSPPMKHPWCALAHFYTVLVQTSIMQYERRGASIMRRVAR